MITESGEHLYFVSSVSIILASLSVNLLLSALRMDKVQLRRLRVLPVSPTVSDSSVTIRLNVDVDLLRAHTMVQDVFETDSMILTLTAQSSA